MNELIVKVKINNVEAHSRYIIARLCEGSLWYFASWDTYDEAQQMIYNLGFDNAIIVDTNE